MAISNSELIKIANSDKLLNKPKSVISNEELIRIANSDRPSNKPAIQSFPPQRPDRFQIKGSQPYESYNYGDAFKDTVKTAINSLANLGENIRTPIQHPIQTVKALGQAAIHPIQTGKAIGGYVKERAGSLEKLASTVSTDPFGFSSDVIGTAYGAKGLTSLAKSGIKSGGKMATNALSRQAENKIFSLYNYSVGGKMKNVGDVTKVKPQRLSAMRTINDNLPDIKFENIDTGILESRIPQNRLELLESLKQSKKLVWEKTTSLSKGATEAKAQINLSSLVDDALKQTEKSIGKVALDTNPDLLKGLAAEAKKIKSAGKINPTQAEEYMKFLNNEVQRLRNSGQAVDFSVKDLYSNVLNGLNEATDNAVIEALGKIGYKTGRNQYSALKSAEKEILGAANKFLRQSGGQGGGITHPIINIWSLEEILKGGVQALTGNISGALQSGGKAVLIRTAGKLSDFFKSPDKRIPQMFKLMEKTYKRPLTIEEISGGIQ